MYGVRLQDAGKQEPGGDWRGESMTSSMLGTTVAVANVGRQGLNTLVFTCH